MKAFLKRRLLDAAFFAILILLLSYFANLLKISAIYDPNADGMNLIIQVQAWLHGHLDIGHSIHDSIVLHGKYYIIYQPLPSLLMLPFIAALGHNFSDVWFTWIFAALNIILLFRILEVMRVHLITRRTMLENLILALTFGFGTIALWMALDGRVWFTVQTVSISGVLFTLHSTISRRWPLATLGTGLVLLTRSSDALIGLFPLLVYLCDLGIGRREQKRRYWLPRRWPRLGELALILLPFALTLAIYLLHNKLYFGNILSTGYDIQNQQDYSNIKFGVLSWHYLWSNFVIDFLRGPQFSFTGPADINPQMDMYIDGIGTSMFFTTPLLAIFIFAPQGNIPQTWLRRALWITTGVMLLAILAFCAAGWRQVGARYLFGIYPPLFLLLALRPEPLNFRWISLAALSVWINILISYLFWVGQMPSARFITISGMITALAALVALLLLQWQRRSQPETASSAQIRAVQAENSSDLPTAKVPVANIHGFIPYQAEK